MWKVSERKETFSQGAEKKNHSLYFLTLKKENTENAKRRKFEWEKREILNSNYRSIAKYYFRQKS